MTLLSVALLILLAAVTLLALHAHRQTRALRLALAALQRRFDAQPQQQREWLAVMAHELRSPVSAVLGYSELLTDGALGALPPRASDAIGRVQQAAEQLLRIIEGIDDLATHRDDQQAVLATVSAQDLLAAALASLQTDAEARGVDLIIDDGDATIVTREDIALRALVLALSAALKVSAGATLRLAVDDAATAAIVIRGTHLDPLRDDPDAAAAEHAPLTGAGLRIALARRAATHVNGVVTLQRAAEHTQLRLELPSLRQPV